MTIKEAREKTNRPAEEIAKLLGFPLKTWLAWEEDERKPPKYIEQLILERLDSLNSSLHRQTRRPLKGLIKTDEKRNHTIEKMDK